MSNTVNDVITRRIELLKNDFIFSVRTASKDNGETNTLNIVTDILLITPRLISLSFTTKENMAGIQANDPERTFLVFDFVNGKSIIEESKLFRNDLAWSQAVKKIKALLLSNYKGRPRCDLIFAPKHSGFAASCIGVDWNRDGNHMSITQNTPISLIQEFVAPFVLSDIVQ